MQTGGKAVPQGATFLMGYLQHIYGREEICAGLVVSKAIFCFDYHSTHSMPICTIHSYFSREPITPCTQTNTNHTTRITDVKQVPRLAGRYIKLQTPTPYAINSCVYEP